MNGLKMDFHLQFGHPSSATNQPLQIFQLHFYQHLNVHPIPLLLYLLHGDGASCDVGARRRDGQ
jgi:hypothetical protein